jgi:hypothetical protein
MGSVVGVTFKSMLTDDNDVAMFRRVNKIFENTEFGREEILGRMWMENRCRKA